jgi:hypothetical protein
MGRLGDFFQAFAAGFINGAAYQLETAASGVFAGSHVECVCRDLGWAVDCRLGIYAGLEFNDPAGKTRRVYVQDDPGGIGQFWTISDALILVRHVPAEVKLFLLSRNAEGGAIGAWHMHAQEDGKAVFVLQYQPTGESLESGVFKWICERMVCEAWAFDETLRRAQILR